MVDDLLHYGVKGMKWGHRKSKYSSEDVIIKKGTTIHRIIPKSWEEKERGYSGHAYASYKKEDTERYKNFAKMFGGDYIDMSFKATKDLVSPSEKKRVEAFIKTINTDQKAKDAFIKATRHPLVFVPKSKLNKLDDPKEAQKVYRKFAYLLVSKKDIRDPYFKTLEKEGYSMVLDDADIKGGISASPIIVFDRKKSLKVDRVEGI